MGPSLVADQGMNLINDQGVHTTHHGAAAGTGKQKIQTLRRRYEDVGASLSWKLSHSGVYRPLEP